MATRVNPQTVDPIQTTAEHVARHARPLSKTTKRTLNRRGVLWLGQTCNLRCYFCYFLNRIEDSSHPEHAFMSLEKAKELGFKYASAGADTNFYGYDYDLGLLAWKAAIRMVPHPEEPFNLIKVLDPSKFAEGKAEGERAGHFFFSIKREGAFYERFLDRADGMTGEEGEGFELIGSAFLEDAIAKPEEMMVGNQFYFDDIVTPAPRQVKTIRRKI